MCRRRSLRLYALCEGNILRLDWYVAMCVSLHIVSVCVFARRQADAKSRSRAGGLVHCGYVCTVKRKLTVWTWMTVYAEKGRRTVRDYKMFCHSVACSSVHMCTPG